VTDGRLWGWLSPDHPDPLAAAPKAEALLAETFGARHLRATPPRPLDPASVPESRLTASMRAALAAAAGGEAIAEDPASRAAASLGQSYPDQLVRRSGNVTRAVDAVVAPASGEKVRAVIAAAGAEGFRLLATGGGSNVVGAFDAPEDPRPLVACALGRINTVGVINAVDRTVTAGPGIRLPELEARLAPHGLTLGHQPQSYEAATLGGSIAANGAGQRSDGYGRIADLLLSAHLETPSGPWTTEALRHAGAGPWLGGLVTGSEGLFGILTEATLAVHALPAESVDEGFLLPDFGAGIEAARTLAQAGAGLAMLRLSDRAETHFLSVLRDALAGRDRPPLAERLVLALKRAPANPCLAVVGADGEANSVAAALAAARAAFRRVGGVALGKRPGASWRRGRYAAPHLREALMARGLGVDTYETAAPWSRLPALHEAVIAALTAEAAAMGVRALVFGHLSHSHGDAGCLYVTAVFPRLEDGLRQWQAMKRAATAAILAHGGALSHHHGLGADHGPWAAAEKGERGLALLSALKRTLDPGGVMASGVAAALP